MVSSPTAHAKGTAVPGIRKVSWGEGRWARGWGGGEGRGEEVFW